MDILPLGTSSGGPTPERSASGCALRLDGQPGWHLIDCSDGTFGRMLAAQKMDKKIWALASLSRIWITHAHGDHCFGIFGILSGLDMMGRSAPLELAAPAEVRSMVESAFGSTRSRLGYEISWVHPEDGLSIEIGGSATVECVALKHRAPSFGYYFRSEKLVSTASMEAFTALGFEPGPFLGEAVSRAKKGLESQMPDGQWRQLLHCIEWSSLSESVFVSGDNSEPGILARRAKGAGVWIHEATYAHDDWVRGGLGESWGHSSAKMLGEAASVGGPGALVLTHFSPRYGEAQIGNLAAEASQAWGGGQALAAKELVALRFEPLRRASPHPAASRKMGPG